MQDIFESVKNSWQSYGLETVSLVFYWIAVLWFFLYRKDRKQNHLYLFAVGSAVCIVIVQLLLAATGRTPVQKLFYLLPVALLTAYAGTEICLNAFSAKKKWIIIVLYAIIIQSGTGWRFTTSYLSNYNDDRISLPVEQIAECIESVEAIENPFVLAPEEVASQIQEYDADIRVAYGEGYQYTENNLEQLLYEMETYGCNMLIIRHEYDDEAYMKKLGLQQVIIFYGYSIYYRI